MPFAEKTYTATRKRASTDYVRFTPAYRNVLRILDDKAASSWKHWITEANQGKGMMATCPGNKQANGCPIDAQITGLSKEDDTYKNKRARKKYVVNVLDRTPHTPCPSCNELTPVSPCVNCQADVKTPKKDYQPLNKIRILEGGPMLFETTLNGVEELGSEDWQVPITGYDITFKTQGEGRDRKISAIPQQPEELGEEVFLDPQTGEPQERFNLDFLTEPTSVEEIELMLQGATVEELNAVRGIS